MKKTVKFLALALMVLSAFCLAACGQSDDQYVVTCAAAEHGSVMVDNVNVRAGAKVILAAHPDAGYQLAYFVVDGEKLDGCSLIMPAKDITVSAEFTMITYTITYVLGDATVDGDNPTTYTVENVPELIQPRMDGYEICGWYRYCVEPENHYGWDMEDYRVDSLVGLYGNLTLYAKGYNPLHEVRCEEYDDDVKGSYYVDLAEARYGDTVQVEVLPDMGYELATVLVNGEPIEGTSFTMPMCDAVVTVTFRPIVYTINYVMIGGDGEMEHDNPQTLTVEDWRLDLAEASMEGYDFKGWFLDAEHTQQVDYIDLYSFDGRSLTLYAYFEKSMAD